MKSLEELKAIKEKMRGQVEFRSEDGVWTEDNPYPQACVGLRRYRVYFFRQQENY